MKLTSVQKSHIRSVYNLNKMSPDSIRNLAKIYSVDISTIYKTVRPVRLFGYSQAKLNRDVMHSKDKTIEQRIVRYIGSIMYKDKHKKNMEIVDSVNANIIGANVTFELVQLIRKFRYARFNNIKRIINDEHLLIAEAKELKLL